MKVSAFVHLTRTADPTTGVGKHTLNMVRGLSRVPGMEVKLLLPRGDLDANGQIPAYSLLRDMPMSSIPLSRALLERLWIFARRPLADNWAGKPDCIYCPMEVYVPAKVPLFTTCHTAVWFEKDLPWYNDPAYRKIRINLGIRYRQLFKRSDRILTVSEFLKGRIVALFGADPDRIDVVYNGVEDVYFDVGDASQPAGGPEKPYVVIVGGLTRWKGADYVFPVIEEVARRNPRIQFRVAGISEGPNKARADQNPNIIHDGFLGLDKLPQLIRGATSLLILSRCESFGIPALEAMAARTPVIASNFEGLPEVVANAGFVMDATKAADIADVIVSLERDSALRQRYADLGRARAEQFRWSSCVDRLVKSLRSLC